MRAYTAQIIPNNIQMLQFEVKEYELHILAKGWDNLRQSTCLEMLKDAHDFYKPRHVPVTRIVIDDKFDYGNMGNERIFCFSTSVNNSQYLIPDSYAKKWTEIGVPSVPKKCIEIEEAGRLGYTVDMAFWIGVASTHATRATLIEISKMRPDLIDARDMSWNNHKVVAHEIPEFVSLERHTDFRYLIDVQGNGWSGRLKYLLFSGRPVFVAQRKWWDWATWDLVAWVHYIPVEENLSDLVDKITWAREHNDEATKIAATAKEFITDRMSRVMSPEGMGKLFAGFL